MKELSIIDRLKSIIANIGWRLFIWGSGQTEEEYWEDVYEWEKANREVICRNPK